MLRQSSMAQIRSGPCAVAQRSSDRRSLLVVLQGFRGEFAAVAVDDDGGVGALVRVDADDHHGVVSP
jgi:hypothetical protein